MIKKIKVDFDWNQFLQADYAVPDYSCATHQKSDNPDLYSEFGDLPASYCLQNTTIHQLWWEDETMKQQLGQLLGIDVVSVSTIEQPCGNTITLHRDHFYKIRTQFPDDARLRVRAVVFLEDWKFGHILHYQTDGEWFCPTHWKQGEGFIWDDQIAHLSGNCGFNPKYTLQVSGFLTT